MTDTDSYDLAFDDRVIPLEEMKRIVWLSPLVPPDLPAPFEMAGSYDGSTRHWDKIFIVRVLERCAPGYTECMAPTLNTAFFDNASRNLTIDRRQKLNLETEKLPTELEPVRGYLLGTMKFFLDIQQARYDFLRSGKLQTLLALLCKYCECHEAEDELIRKASEMQGRQGIEFTGTSVANRVLECWTSRDPGYPMSAWKSFLAQYHLREEHKFLPVD